MSHVYRLLTYLWPYRIRFGVAVLLSCLVSGLYAFQAWLAKPAIDDMLISKNETWLLLLPLLLIAVTWGKGVVSYAQSYLMTYVGVRVVTDVRRHVFYNLMRLPMGFHVKHPSSHMLSRTINDVNWIQNSIASVLKDVFQSGLTFIALLGYVLFVNWPLALVSIVVLPVTAVPIISFGRRMRKFATRGQERTADMSQALQETLTGIRIVKGFTQEIREDRRFETINQAYFRTWMKSTQVSALTTPVVEGISILGIAAIVWFGGFQVMNGDMTPGGLMSFVTAVVLMYGPVRRIAGANNIIQQALAAAIRVFAVLDQETEDQLDRGTKVIEGVRKEIDIRNVSYQYDGAERPSLRRISLTLRAGELVALVGSSGAGKTTLANMIPRFYEPTEGGIFIDGVNIRDIKLSALRQQIGIVSQETHLFDATVRDNIAYGTDQESQEATVEAAKAAFAHPFIMNMPQGYETMIGENGVKLSGGERQRIAIARAILRNPPILILDEATSSLDSESERMVQLALENLVKNRTTLVIAHRLSTVQHANRIVVLERGEVVEFGSHQELLKRGGVYSRLHAIQFRQVQEVKS